MATTKSKIKRKKVEGTEQTNKYKQHFSPQNLPYHAFLHLIMSHREHSVDYPIQSKIHSPKDLGFTLQ